ncbi:hypothetical protein CDAR_52291 [Caerostris darwini]|uniref:Uncharacterized protein n=1 Tax=Caerostris darwini TaxID=1538125 RepID=A0AAV4V292_9ARAC|nr:hypothetical protein CDAR_52291 [Caerostris darwini]
MYISDIRKQPDDAKERKTDPVPPSPFREMPENNNVRFIRKQHDLRMQGMHHSEGRLIYKGVFSGGIHYKTFRRRANKGAKMGRGQINQ